MKQSYLMGALNRGMFRRLLFQWGLHYTEDRGWLDSAFWVTGTEEEIESLSTIIEEWVTEKGGGKK